MTDENDNDFRNPTIIQVVTQQYLGELCEEAESGIVESARLFEPCQRFILAMLNTPEKTPVSCAACGAGLHTCFQFDFAVRYDPDVAAGFCRDCCGGDPDRIRAAAGVFFDLKSRQREGWFQGEWAVRHSLRPKRRSLAPVGKCAAWIRDGDRDGVLVRAFVPADLVKNLPFEGEA